MSAVAPYTHDERKATRALVKRLEDYAVRAENILHGRAAFDGRFVAAVHALTDASDLDNQVRALRRFATDRQKAHLTHLAALGPQDLTAFAEVMSPNEPPAKHHIWLSDKLMAVEAKQTDRVMLSMPPGHAKDLCIKTPVMMGDGTWKPLGDVEVGDMVMSGRGRPREVLAVHDQGVRPVSKVTTESGRSVITHGEHQFLTPGGWTRADELDLRSTLTHPVTFEAHNPIPDRSRDEFILAGYMMARAVVTGRAYSRLHRINTQFRADDPAILADIKAITARMNIEHRQTQEQRYGAACVLLTFAPAMGRWLDEVGLYGERKESARVPDWVFRGTDDDICAFLGAIVSCDAQLFPKLNLKNRKHLVMQIQCKDNPGLRDDLIKLLYRIGVNAHSQTSHFSNYNYSPVTFFKLKIVDVDGLATMRRRLRIIGNTKRFWELPISAGTWGNGEYRGDPVVKIEEHKPTKTRCITVEEDHSFIANGLVVHNSTYCSRYYPAWYLGKAENRLYLQAGHSKPFARTEFGRKTKDLVTSEAYRTVFPGLGVRFDAKASDDWTLTNGNRYVTKGVGEGISGFRSTANGVDDPYKDYDSAQSPLRRKKVWDWFVGDFMTRLLPGGSAFVIQTRWHIDDIIGALDDMAQRGEIEPWDYYNLPVFCDDPEQDHLNRDFGEEIWPDFYTKAVLLRQKQLSSTHLWSCLYEGKPLPQDGNIIKTQWLTDRYTTIPSIRLYDPTKHAFSGNGGPPFSSEEQSENAQAKHGEQSYRRTVLSCDSAEKDGERNDFTAITVWRETPDSRHYLVDAHRERMQFTRLVECVNQFANSWACDVVLMEEKGAGNQYIQHMAQEQNVPFTVVGINPGRDGKIFRMDSVTPIFMNKGVVLPLKASWLAVLERELLQFPGGKNDDYADSVSQYLKWARDNGLARRGSRKLGGVTHRRRAA